MSIGCRRRSILRSWPGGGISTRTRSSATARPDREGDRRRTAEARLRGHDRRRHHGRGRRAARRQAGARGRAASRHGCVAGHRARRSAVQVHGQGEVERAGDRRDARLRPRQPHGDSARRRDRARADEGSPAGHREGDLSAGRRRSAAWRSRRRRADGEGERAGEPEGRRHLRPARVSVSGRRRSSTGPAR